MRMHLEPARFRSPDDPVLIVSPVTTRRARRLIRRAYRLARVNGADDYTARRDLVALVTFDHHVVEAPPATLHLVG